MIQLNPTALAFLAEEQAKGNYVAYAGGTKYDLKHVLNTEPIPVSLTADAPASANGVVYPYGSFRRVFANVPGVDGYYPHRTKGTREAIAALPPTGAINVGVYTASEDILTSSGKVIKKGSVSVRVDVVK